MRTLFVNRLEPTNDQRALYDWFVSNGHTPEDVMILCTRGGRKSSWALVRFPDQRSALMALEALDGKRYNHPKSGLRLHFSQRELEPPTDPRWDGRWLNYTPRANQDVASLPGNWQETISDVVPYER